MCGHVGCEFSCESKARLNSHQRAFNSHTEHFDGHKESCALCLAMLECGEWTDLSVYEERYTSWDPRPLSVVVEPTARAERTPRSAPPSAGTSASLAATPPPGAARPASASPRRFASELWAATAPERRSPQGSASPTAPASPPPTLAEGSASGSSSGSGSASGDGSIDFFQCSHDGCRWRSRAQGDNDKRASVAKHEKSVVKHRSHFEECAAECLCCQTLLQTGVWRVIDGALLDVTLRKHRSLVDAVDAGRGAKRAKLLSGAAGGVGQELQPRQLA